MATLSQVGIPGIGLGILSPKHKNHWRVIFRGLGGITGATGNAANDLSLQVVTFTRPSIEWEEQVMDRYNSRAYGLGKHTFAPATLTVEDDVSNRASRAIQLQLEKQQRLIGASGPWLNTNATSGSFKFGAELDMLDGNELVLESWKLEGCMFTAVDYQDLDYTTGDKMMINITMRFDHARQQLYNDIVGSAIGGTINDGAE